MHRFFFFLSFLILSACSSPAYRAQYTHLRNDFSPCPPMNESDYFLVILVNARHLDYANTSSLLKTIAKHPDDGGKNGDVGHAWIYLQGIVGGKAVFIEGGHSGELGRVQPKYFDGVMDYIDYGCEPNPIKYLWEIQHDGFFQNGSGGHTPSFAAKIDLTQEQFNNIRAFILSDYSNYAEYSLTNHQCASFVVQTAALANFPIDYEISIPIDQVIRFRGRTLRLWRAPEYSRLRFGSPDIIERSLMQSVKEGRAEYALPWYQKSIMIEAFNRH